MQIDAGRGKLYDALEVARHQWQDVCEQWTDATNAAFRKDTWDPLDHLSGECLRRIDRLRTLLNECRRECEGQET